MPGPMNSDFHNSIRVYPWFDAFFWVSNQRKSDWYFVIFIRTYARFWGERKFAIGVFGLRTAAQ